jgi:predicted protein tyrosine phosphatase
MTDTSAPAIHVCSLSVVGDVATRIGASRIITLLGPGPTVETPAHVAPVDHLRLTFNDINGPREGLIHPSELHIEQIIDHAKSWNQASPLLIHCWAGISRSTAAALIAACVLRPERDERIFANALRQASPTATPNIWMINLADQMLGRNGRLFDAVNDIGQGELATEGVPFKLDLGHAS